MWRDKVFHFQTFILCEAIYICSLRKASPNSRRDIKEPSKGLMMELFCKDREEVKAIHRK